MARCGLYVSRFPGLSSVFISDEPHKEQDEIRAVDHHTAFILRTLAAINGRLEKLVTYNY